MERITSRQNEKIRQTAFLKHRSEREKTGCFFFEGVHLLEEYLRFGHVPECVFVTEEAYPGLSKLLDGIDNVYLVTESVYEKMTDERSPQGVLCVSRFLENVKRTKPVKGSLFLESLRDNGNVGTIIRTAASIGINGICISADCADLYSPKTVRATMGALFSTDITVVDDMPSAVKELRADGFRVFAAILNEKATKLGETPMRCDDSFVIGNEGSGVSPETVSVCDGGVYIPMSGKTESLNASAAAAIIIWEMKKSENG